eukprot:Nitzschia sp. Nitz4//scaffold253_size28098//9209//15122//NITZ4_008141-RA/size28098-processed-gene-0.22-mRNA-1//1//CDS//3329544300//1440//frame0
MPPPPPPPRRRGVGATDGQPPPPPPRPLPMPSTSPATPTTYSMPTATTTSVSSSTTTTHRRTPAKASDAPSFHYGAATHTSTSYMAPHAATSYPMPRKNESGIPTPATTANLSPRYQHNTAALLLILPCLASVLLWHDSAFTIKVFLFVALSLYALDLINAREAFAVSLWFAAFIMTIASGISTLLQVDDSEATGGRMIFFLLQLAVEGFPFGALSIWLGLHIGWMCQDVPTVAMGLERTLHVFLPPVSSAILSFSVQRFLADYWGSDLAALAFPHLFALLLALGMWSLGSASSSFHSDATSPSTGTDFAISSYYARLHSMLLLLLPASMHLLIFRARIFSRQASMDELYELILIWALPYLLHCLILFVSDKSPYEMNNGLFPHPGENTLRGALIPIVVSLVASFAAQQRFVISLCLTISYQFNGHQAAPTWLISLFLTVATIAVMFALWTWGRKSSVTGEYLFGEYHEDVVQLAISLCGLLLGKAFGMPWNLTPLPILAFLGLSVWMTTRMLRYLVVFLFVLHATGLVLFSYRFASIDMEIPLAIPGIRVKLVRLGMLEVIASILIGLFAGFVLRPSGGVGAAILRRIDVPGLLLLGYSAALAVLECTLLKRPVPFETLVGNQVDVGLEDAGFLYDHATVLLSAVVLGVLAVFSYRHMVVSKYAFVAVLAMAVGKAAAIFVDASEVDGKLRKEDELDHVARRLLFRIFAASVLLAVIMGAPVLLDPVYIKTPSSFKRSIQDGKPLASLPDKCKRNIFMYVLFVVPLALLVAIPVILSPMVMAFTAHHSGGAYYKASPPPSEMLGIAVALWGVASLTMMNRYLPDGGAETWKKMAALGIVVGIGIAFAAPTMPSWLVGTHGVNMSNPYAPISSAGDSLAKQGRSRTGGWGILLACIATLLAVTGPLELRERRHPSGRKDQYLLLRLMAFSLLFGSGVSWFVTIQCMAQENFFVVLITALSCLIIAFFGIITCVLSYFLEIENFDDAIQMAKIWVGTFVVFGLLTGVPSTLFSSASMHLFGPGGWLTTFLLVNTLVAMSISMSLRMRRSKSQATRGFGNFCCLFGYACALSILYGSYGVSGMDHTFVVVQWMGMPIPVVGTILLAPLLLALEGETAGERKSRVARVTGASSGPSSQVLSITLPNLKPSNRFAPLVGATYAVFALATVYAIFLRGCLLPVAMTHFDVFSKMAEADSKNGIAQLARQAATNSKTLIVSAKMAGEMIMDPLHPGPLPRSAPTTPEYRDTPFAIAFFLHLFAVMSLALVGGRKLYYHDFSSAADDDGVETTSLWRIWVLLLFVSVVAIGLSAATLEFMTHHTEQLIQFTLVFSCLSLGAVVLLLFWTGSPFLALCGGILLLFVVWYSYRVQRRIPFASANLQTALAAIQMNYGVCIIAYTVAVATFFWLMVWQVAVVEFALRNLDSMTGVHINAAIFFLLLISYFWTSQVLQNILHVTVSGVVGTWWFAPQEAQSTLSPAVIDSFLRSTSYSFGSICFGSLFVAIVQALHEVLRMLRRRREGNIILCLLECLVHMLQRIGQYFNKWNFVYVGLYGYDYLTAGKKALELFHSRGLSTVVTDDLVHRLLVLVCFVVAAMVGFVGMILEAWTGWASPIFGETSKFPVFAVCCTIGYSLASVTMSTVVSGVNSVMVCYAEAPAEFESQHPALYQEMAAAWHSVYPQNPGV